MAGAATAGAVTAVGAAMGAIVGAATVAVAVGVAIVAAGAAVLAMALLSSPTARSKGPERAPPLTTSATTATPMTPSVTAKGDTFSTSGADAVAESAGATGSVWAKPVMGDRAMTAAIRLT
jgi:hypothetical protein